MGQIICPDGMSVQNDKINGFVPFEYLVRDMKSECCTWVYRAKCILALGDVGFFNQAKEIGKYLAQLYSETESNDLREACKIVMTKYKIKKKKLKESIPNFLV